MNNYTICKRLQLTNNLLKTKRFTEIILRRQPQYRMNSGEATRSDKLRFDGQTAIITGAGRGLGREYALLLASRGANVVVNDFGGSRSGDTKEVSPAAQQVVDETLKRIAKEPSNKNRAVANYDSVSSETGAKQLVEQAMKEFGRVDILINNAGILRDKSFGKMEVDDWDQVVNVHLRGSFLMARACWPIMRQQAEGGRVVMTSSTSGLYGNFGQANYAAAKMALIGLSNTLAIEGKRNKIHCNVIVPMAASRMTQDILPEELAIKLSPSYVAPMVAWLCHRDCSENGSIFEAAGRWYGKYRLQRSHGNYLPRICDKDDSIEQIRENLESISNFEQPFSNVQSFNDHLSNLIQTFERENDGLNNK